MCRGCGQVIRVCGRVIIMRRGCGRVIIMLGVVNYRGVVTFNY